MATQTQEHDIALLLQEREAWAMTTKVTRKQEREAWIKLWHSYNDRQGLHPIHDDWYDGLCTYVCRLDIAYYLKAALFNVIDCDLETNTNCAYLYGKPCEETISHRLAYVELQILCLS